MNLNFMDPEFDIGTIRSALRSVGELLAAEGERIPVVVVGGAAMNLHGLVERTTSDVDVIAQADPKDLLALQPTDAELNEAKEWVFTQDLADGWPDVVDQVVEHVRRNR